MKNLLHKALEIFESIPRQGTNYNSSTSRTIYIKHIVYDLISTALCNEKIRKPQKELDIRLFRCTNH